MAFASIESAYCMFTAPASREAFACWAEAGAASCPPRSERTNQTLRPASNLRSSSGLLERSSFRFRIRLRLWWRVDQQPNARRFRR